MQRSILARVGSSPMLALPAEAAPAQAMQGAPAQAISAASAVAAPAAQAMQGVKLPLTADSELAKQAGVRAAMATSGFSIEQVLKELDEAMKQKSDKQKDAAADRRSKKRLADAESGVMKRPAMASATAPPSKATSSAPRIVLAHEKSRHQWLVRIPEKKSKSFAYGEGGDSIAAQARAKQYIREQCKASHIPVPAAFK